MKKILKESITQNQALSLYDKMPEDEKISWKKAIEDCVNDYLSKSGDEKYVAKNFKFSLFGGGFGLALIIVGIKLNIIELVLMGAGAIAWLAKMTIKDWKIIIDCAREKKGIKNSDDTSSVINTNESVNKKTIRLTESELVGLIKKVISEQDEDRQTTRGIQKFLNEKLKLNLKVDGLTGPNSETSEAIRKYQGMIGVIPTDGVWGHDTWEKMPEKDRLRLRKLVADEGGVLDKIWNYFGWDD